MATTLTVSVNTIHPHDCRNNHGYGRKNDYGQTTTSIEMTCSIAGLDAHCNTNVGCLFYIEWKGRWGRWGIGYFHILALVYAYME